jgi:hypothetical protein
VIDVLRLPTALRSSVARWRIASAPLSGAAGSGQMETIRIPTPGSVVRNISIDSARSRVWLALSGTGRIGKIELK